MDVLEQLQDWPTLSCVEKQILLERIELHIRKLREALKPFAYEIRAPDGHDMVKMTFKESDLCRAARLLNE